MFQTSYPLIGVGGRPEMESVADTRTTTAPPALTVTANGETSTAGVLARNKSGQWVMTMAYHGTGDVGTDVNIGSATYRSSQATVSSTHPSHLLTRHRKTSGYGCSLPLIEVLVRKSPSTFAARLAAAWTRSSRASIWTCRMPPRENRQKSTLRPS